MAYQPASNVPLTPWKWWVTFLLPPVAFVMLLVFREKSGGLLSTLHVYNADFLALLTAVYYLGSIRQMPLGRYGGVTIFGQPALQGGPGLYYVPLFIGAIYWYPVNRINMQFPAEPENISKRPDTSPLREKEFLPIRITSAPPKDDGKGILNEQLSPEFTFSTVLQMGDGEFFELFVAIPGETWDDKLNTIRYMVRDTAEGILTGIVSKLTPPEINASLVEIAKELKQKLQEAVQDWGIVIHEVQMQAPDYGTGIAHALAKIPQAKADAEVTGITSLATQNASVLVAEGQAQARERLAKADAAERAAKGEGDAEAAKALGMTGVQYLGLKTGVEAIGKGTLILGEQGIAQAVGVGAAIIKQFPPTEEKKED